MATKVRATIDDLYRVDGKAELVNGEIVRLMATGRMPAYAALEIALSLRVFVRQAKLPGVVVADNAGFTVSLPNRQSFSPDAACYEGPDTGTRLFEGAPRFGVEVRSENDYGIEAEREMAAKRRDYFAAGTRVLWDVDLLSEAQVVRKHTLESGADRPECVFVRGEVADAEPAVPGWRLPVGDLFENDGRAA